MAEPMTLGEAIKRARKYLSGPDASGCSYIDNFEADVLRTLLAAAKAREGEVIPMVLHCPECGHRHIDRPAPGWDNPPHRSHLCSQCACIWRPADVPTTGVAAIKTRGKADTYPVAIREIKEPASE